MFKTLSSNIFVASINLGYVINNNNNKRRSSRSALQLSFICIDFNVIFRSLVFITYSLPKPALQIILQKISSCWANDMKVDDFWLDSLQDAADLLSSLVVTYDSVIPKLSNVWKSYFHIICMWLTIRPSSQTYWYLILFVFFSSKTVI